MSETDVCLVPGLTLDKAPRNLSCASEPDTSISTPHTWKRQYTFPVIFVCFGNVEKSIWIGIFKLNNSWLRISEKFVLILLFLIFPTFYPNFPHGLPWFPRYFTFLSFFLGGGGRRRRKSTQTENPKKPKSVSVWVSHFKFSPTIRCDCGSNANLSFSLN